MVPCQWHYRAIANQFGTHILEIEKVQNLMRQLATLDKVRKGQLRLIQPTTNGSTPVVEKRQGRRFELEFALRYRVDGEGHWHRGRSRNISGSGVLFQGDDWTEPCTRLEMSLVLPKEIIGAWPLEVVCRATVTRSVRPDGDEDGAMIASRISHYRFVRP